ncbi:hypothetical protein HERIO_1891 [Hepatospora eriocheir]|uniref:Uncharacterized protein n=1 Tax=Hepatospora eriocheir TaxID=1081669 RepID=A0A1X0Q8Q8_9MICR|nr:hypothetical protein HERIO_1891 [Hepatospora eriocheir]
MKLIEYCFKSKNTGNKFIKELTKELRTVHVNYFIKNRSFEELKIFILTKLEKIISEYSIECVVIENIDSYLYTEENLESKRSDINLIVKKLKNIINKYQTEAIVSTLYIKGYEIEGIFINRYLGYKWCYLRNEFYLK